MAHDNTDATRRNFVNRRKFLKSAGIVSTAGIAGCTGGGDGGGGDGGDGGGGDGDGGGGSGGTVTGTVTPSDAIVIDYWTLFTGGDGKVMKAVTDQFNEEHDDIFVKRQRVPWDEFYTKLFTALTGGNQPDVTISHMTQLRKFEELFRDLSQDDVSLDPFLANPKAQATVGDKILALPLDIHPVGLYYNLDLVEEAGHDPENLPTEWEGFKTLMDDIVANTDADMALTPGVETRWFSSLVYSQGDQFLSGVPDDPKAAFNTQNVLDLFEVWDKMVEEWNWTVKDNDVAFEAFNSGRSGLMAGGTWDYSNFKEGSQNALEFDWRLETPDIGPHSDPNAEHSLGDSHSLAIPKDPNRSDEKLEAALTFIEWLSVNEYWPYNSGHLPATKENFKQSKAPDNLWDKTWHFFHGVATEGNVEYWPRTTKNREFRGKIWANLTATRTQNKDPKPAIDAAEKQVNRVFR